MHTRNKKLLLSVIILSVFCINMVCWGQGIIVFSLWFDVYMMRPDDAEPTLISNETGWSTPSPDGRFLAETGRDVKQQNNLYIRHLSTGKKIRSLKLQAHNRFDICWSPDGRWIVYAGPPIFIGGEVVVSDIHLISPDGKQNQHIHEQIDKEPRGFEWTPDSQSVFYNSDSRKEISELNINDKHNPKKHKLFYEGAGLYGNYPTYAFSPNGEQIAYTSHEGLFVADVDGANHRRVVDNERLKRVFQVDWSPNGKHLVFSGSRKIGESVYGLYIFSFESKQVRRLVSFQDNFPRRPRWVRDSLAVHPSNKMAVTWGEIKNLNVR